MRFTLLSFTLALLPLTAAAELTPEVRARVQSALERGNRSGDRVTRGLATELLASFDPTTAALAVDALKDPVFEVRLAAVSGLQKAGDARWEAAIVEELRNPRSDMPALLGVLFRLPEKDVFRLVLPLFRDEKVQSRAPLFEAFTKAETKWMIAFLKAFLAEKNTQLVEMAQNVALSMKTPESKPLLDHLLATGTPVVKQRALEVYAELPRGTDLGPVKKLLKGKDKTLSLDVAKVLARHGDRAAVPTLLPELASTDPKVVVATLDALMEVPGMDLVPSLEQLLKKPDENIEITRRVLELRFRAGDAKLAELLKRYRASLDVRLQALAVYFLGVSERGRALADLHESVFHGDVNVQVAAIEAIGKIAHHDSIAVLKRALDATNDPALRSHLVASVAAIKDADVIPVLQFLVSDRQADVRRNAIMGLARVTTREAVPTLKIAVNDSDIEARTTAVRAIVTLDNVEGPATYRMALGWMPPEAVLDMAEGLGESFAPYLDMCLTSTRSELHDAALAALTKMPGKEDGLLTAAFDRTRDVGLKAKILTRFTTLQGAAVLPRLEAAAKPGVNPALRAAAVSLAGTVGDVLAEGWLTGLLEEPDERVRVEAAIALVKIHAKLPPAKGKKPRKR